MIVRASSAASALWAPTVPWRDEWPKLTDIRAAARRLRPFIRQTPVFEWSGPFARDLFGNGTQVYLKLEVLQETGSFKVRGALNAALAIEPEARHRGFTTFSSGNHAAAVAYAARVLGTTAKVVMPTRSNVKRVANCQRYGAEVLRSPDGPSAVARVQEIVRMEGRSFIHPYEGPYTSCGAATLGLELHDQLGDLDAVVVAIGGGGLCSGLGLAFKQLDAACQILAVEPEGADTMHRSFQSGEPENLAAVKTIADSLAPPTTQPYSLGICRATVDCLALIGDDQIRDAMRLMFRDFSLAIEPGGAAALAGALYQFRDQIAGKRVAVVVCGSNIDHESFVAVTR